MDPILYIEVGGVVWQVFPDGTWLQLPVSQPKVEGVQVVTIEPQNLEEALPLTEPQIAVVNPPKAPKDGLLPSICEKKRTQ